MDFRRMIKCSNCNSEKTISVSTDFELKEIVVAGRCPCGATLQATYNVVAASSPPYEPPKTPEPQSPTPDLTLDESLFGGELPSDTLRDLMEE